MTKTCFFPSYRRRSIQAGAAGTRRGDAGGTGGAQRRDSGGGAGESAGLTKMAAAMERFVEVVKQYPGQQQVDLAVEIEVPGSWFGAGPMGSLTVTEQRELPRRGQRVFSHVFKLTTQTRGRTPRLRAVMPTPTIPSISSNLRRPSMPPSVCLSSPTRNRT